VAAFRVRPGEQEYRAAAAVAGAEEAERGPDDPADELSDQIATFIA
jgi:hypothetical protein